MSQESNPRPRHPLAPVAAALESPLGDHALFYLTQLEHTFRSATENSIQEFDLDLRQYSTLAFIVDGHAPTQQELSQLLRLDLSQVVSLTKGLEARGLLVRQTAAHDRRAKTLAITAAGRRLYAQAALEVRRVEEHLTASLSRRDHIALRALLGRILPLP
ncbi:MarR family transcriptional regulator [Enteractinococcus fodinae]|uniref:DNA-binding MarR family transcriptional regulator n=1 Tax=Enteractinococcus fodinae TaxID=684663 RepID=A0ABU2B097_9MICC|nr:MarR family winged helix-turn-helix transcriptional regulator [Enteractinococcus fodinae]MDR7346218.1 DNA-binding MarR family transcriptional regulator [Enteractinococcus fodinae]